MQIARDKSELGAKGRNEVKQQNQFSHQFKPVRNLES